MPSSFNKQRNGSWAASGKKIAVSATGLSETNALQFPHDSTRSWKSDRGHRSRVSFANRPPGERRIIYDADAQHTFLGRDTAGYRPRNMESVRCRSQRGHSKTTGRRFV